MQEDAKINFKEDFEKLFGSNKESANFKFDSYDWGRLQYLLELYFFLNKRRTEGMESPATFLILSLYPAALLRLGALAQRLTANIGVFMLSKGDGMPELHSEYKKSAPILKPR